MPSRILREGILTSRRVNLLSDPAELFYRRLMSKIDDHGRYEADLELIRTACYPLRVDRVKAIHIKKWLDECRAAHLIVVYVVEGKAYLQYLDWRQQHRTQSRYPPPSEQVLTDARQAFTNVHLGVCVGVVEVEGEGVLMSGEAAPDVGPLNGHNLTATARRVLEFLNSKTGSRYQPVKANVDLIVGRLREGFTEADLNGVIAKKFREWGADDKMRHYLRPLTLFRASNFAQYHGERRV